MERHAPTRFVTAIVARVWQRSPGSTVGSVASSVTLGEVAHCSPDEALQRLGSSANGLTTEEAVDRLQGKWAADVRAYDQIHVQILAMADMLSAGIVQQFPQRFR